MKMIPVAIVAAICGGIIGWVWASIYYNSYWKQKLINRCLGYYDKDGQFQFFARPVARIIRGNKKV